MTKLTIPWNETFDKNKMYIWVSEKGEHTCDECKSLDGKMFFGDKIPPRPHPNCKCRVMEINEDTYWLMTDYIEKSFFTDAVANYGNKYAEFDASMLWNIAANRFNSKEAKEYISKNGRVIDRVSDLKNKNLEIFIRRKLKQQIGTEEARGIVFHYESSLAKAIKNDINFQKKILDIISSNKNNLMFRHFAQNTSLGGFKSSNLRHALGRVDIIDICMDNANNLYLKIVDTYDFNKGEIHPAVVEGRKLQEKGLIENYYSIIEIKINSKELKSFTLK